MNKIQKEDQELGQTVAPAQIQAPKSFPKGAITGVLGNTLAIPVTYDAQQDRLRECTLNECTEVLFTDMQGNTPRFILGPISSELYESAADICYRVEVYREAYGISSFKNEDEAAAARLEQEAATTNMFGDKPEPEDGYTNQSVYLSTGPGEVWHILNKSTYTPKGQIMLEQLYGRVLKIRKLLGGRIFQDLFNDWNQYSSEIFKMVAAIAKCDNDWKANQKNDK